MSTPPQPTPNALPLPLPEALNPDALDVLSELAHLLTRLRALPTPTTASSTTTTTGATPAAAATTSHATPTPTALLSSHAARKPGGGSGGGELTLKEIPVATDALKHRFQRARTLVKTTLPDLDRGVADQELEIGALEARIARQRDTLAKLREVGAALAAQGEGEGDKMEE
ncbi:RNA polymerase II transcription mediator complex subunit 9-domain-containing protein [Ustulina deusta]|nr:RNA polymerase II transcription mediator complex subunit 9-domain-containing protein [Ustulina deusta]